MDVGSLVHGAERGEYFDEFVELCILIDTSKVS